MSDYELDIHGDISLSDYSIIEDYMKVLSDKDQLTISLKENNQTDTEFICNMLLRDNFEIMSKGGCNNGKYFIQAFKKE